MKPQDIAELVLLAALWGASFLFMRLGVGEFGPWALAAARVAVAAALLLPLLGWRGQTKQLLSHWRDIAFVGVVNSALPFVAFSYAALYVSAGLSAIFNATSPLWAALVAWAWLHDKPTRWRAAGLAIGFAGVAWLTWDKAGFKAGAGLGGATAAVLACLLSTICYGIGANFTKTRLTGVAPLAVAAGSQVAAALVLVPVAWFTWPASLPGARAWAAVLMLGALSTGLAYLLYFRLIANVGPARAISVTFLIPLFAMLWGGIFLREAVTPVMAAAGAVILIGTALATGLVAPGVRRSA